MIENIDTLASTSEFNGVKLLDNNHVNDNSTPLYKDTMIGAMDKETLKIPVFNIQTEMLKDEDGNTLKEIDVRDGKKIGTALKVVDASIEQISSIRSKYGSIQKRLESTGENLDDNILTVTRAESNIRDADIALEMANLAKSQILNDTTIALMQQSNQLPQDALRVLERVK